MTLSSWLKGSDASPERHNTSLSPYRTFSWLPVVRKQTNASLEMFDDSVFAFTYGSTNAVYGLLVWD